MVKCRMFVHTHPTRQSSLHLVKVLGMTSGHQEHVIDSKLSDIQVTLVTGSGRTGSDKEVTLMGGPTGESMQ